MQGQKVEVFIKSELSLAKFAQKLAPKLNAGVVFLNGNLGAGKTAFVREIIGALGYNSRVKSPTYTLVETYNLPMFKIHHFDLYRLSDAQELEFLGIRDYTSDNSLIFFEWWNKGEGFLPKADLFVDIKVNKKSERVFSLIPKSDKAKNWLIGIGQV